MFGSSSLDAIYPHISQFTAILSRLFGRIHTTNASSSSIVIFIINDKRQREELNGIAIQREDLSNSMTG
jgi:hypothetical protein